jgi:hypothetical protein
MFTEEQRKDAEVMLDQATMTSILLVDDLKSKGDYKAADELEAAYLRFDKLVHKAAGIDGGPLE